MLNHPSGLEDYIKSLEAENEVLRQRLEVSEFKSDWGDTLHKNLHIYHYSIDITDTRSDALFKTILSRRRLAAHIPRTTAKTLLKNKSWESWVSALTIFLIRVPECLLDDAMKLMDKEVKTVSLTIEYNVPIYGDVDVWRFQFDHTPEDYKVALNEDSGRLHQYHTIPWAR